MKGTIPRQFVQDLVARTPIAELIGQRVKLKQKGSNYYGCCPFHLEKTPSFTVSEPKQFYHCFGCGAHGNAIDFLIAFERLSFPEAIEQLAGLQAIAIPYETGSSDGSTELRQQLYEIMNKVAAHYQGILQGPAGSEARRYLAARGIEASMMARYGIGFAPEKDVTLLHWAQKDPQDRNALLQAEILIARRQVSGGSSWCSRFRQRVTFPIRDQRGRVLGFGARALAQEKPKYLNSPDTPIFHKGDQLYGLFEVRQQHTQFPNRLILVEGYLDVIALAQSGITNAVAALGTATTNRQIQELFRTSSHIICCYDGDLAGKKAAWRTLENALPHLASSRKLEFIFLPEDEDPDSFIKKHGVAAFQACIAAAVPFSQFFFETLLTEGDLSLPEGRAQCISRSKELLDRLLDPILKQALEQTLLQKLGYPEMRQLARTDSGTIKWPMKEARSSESDPIKVTPMRLLISLLLGTPHLARCIRNTELFSETHIKGGALFVALIKACQVSEKMTTGQLLEQWRDKKEYRFLRKLAFWEHMIHADAVEHTFMDTINHVYNMLIDRIMEKMSAKDRTEGLTSGEREEYVALLYAVKKERLDVTR